MIGKKFFGLEIKRETIEDMALVAVIILVGTGSFGLGRLSVKETSNEPLKITQNGEIFENTSGQINESVSASAGESLGGEVIASKNGTKYHYSWCPGAKQISEANKIAFTTAKAAEEAGYSRALNCKEI